MESEVSKWKEMLNNDIPTIIEKVAVPDSFRWSKDARVFYTMKKLEATDKQVTKMLRFYKDEALLNRYPTEEKIELFFTKIGLDAKKAMAIFKDESQLTNDLAFANQEFKKSQDTGVPTFVVNGKYKVKFDSVKSANDIYEILRALSHKK